jgi:hypothetical protein
MIVVLKITLAVTIDCRACSPTVHRAPLGSLIIGRVRCNYNPERWVKLKANYREKIAGTRSSDTGRSMLYPPNVTEPYEQCNNCGAQVPLCLIIPKQKDLWLESMNTKSLCLRNFLYNVSIKHCLLQYVYGGIHSIYGIRNGLQFQWPGYGLDGPRFDWE